MILTKDEFFKYKTIVVDCFTATITFYTEDGQTFNVGRKSIRTTLMFIEQAEREGWIIQKDTFTFPLWKGPAGLIYEIIGAT